VDEHRRVPGGEDEAIATHPARVLRVVAEITRPQLERDVREPHRRAWVTTVRLFDAVHRQRLDRVHRELDLLRGIFARHLASSSRGRLDHASWPAGGVQATTAVRDVYSRLEPVGPACVNSVRATDTEAS